MSRVPRLLTIMGSGETAPTMVKVHRAVVERLGPDAGPGVLLDTPFGFQTNAAELAARAVGYFRDSVGAALEIAQMRSAADAEGPAGAALVSRLAAAPLLFAGPGSPSYALRQWRPTLVPGVLAEKLGMGGAITFASAAALTLGAVTVPVYEVYKVGEDPRWLEGLDLLAPVGLPVAVVPHYDNAEGGTHDTRFCYLGEQRLAALERDLPEGTFVLGVDEHTALCADLDAGLVSVAGHGGVTVRAHGRSVRIEAGDSMALGRLAEMAEDLRTGAVRAGRVSGDGGPAPAPGEDSGGEDSGGEDVAAPGPDGAAVPGPGSADGRRPPGGAPPLVAAVRRHESAFRAARRAGDAKAMVAAVLALDEELWAWSADTLQSDALDRGRAALTAMVVALGEVAALGTRDPATVVAPFVDLALSLRDAARRERRFADADAVRDTLGRLGVEVRDAPTGSTWVLADRPGAAAPHGSGAEPHGSGSKGDC